MKRFEFLRVIHSIPIRTFFIGIGVLLNSAVLSAQSSAVANAKELADYRTKVVDHGIGKTSKIWQDKCGCPLVFRLDKSLDTVTALTKASKVVESVATLATANCTSPASKQALCSIKEIRITRGKKPGFYLEAPTLSFMVTNFEFRAFDGESKR